MPLKRQLVIITGPKRRGHMGKPQGQSGAKGMKGILEQETLFGFHGKSR